jgi:hypothetical protein
MLCLMLNLRFKSLHIIFSFFGHEEGVNIVEKYDRRSLYPTILKCYHYLHPMVEGKLVCRSNNICRF